MRHAADALRVPSLNDARKAVTFRSADNVHVIAFRKDGAFDFVADFVFSSVFEFELFKYALCFDAGFFELSRVGFVYVVFLNSAERYFYGFVSVTVFRFDLYDGSGTCLDNRYGYNGAVCREYLAHAQFLSNDCFIHR